MSSSTIGGLGGGGAREFEPGTRRVGELSRIPAFVRQFGVDPASVLAEAGVKPETLADPAGRIAWESCARLLRVAAARTHCPHFGLHVGRGIRLAERGAPGELARNSPTVGAALQELVVDQHLNSEGALAFLLRKDDALDLGYATYVPFTESTKQIYDAGLAASMSHMLELCGGDWNPSEVFFPHSKPVDLAPYRRLFRAPVRFNSTFCALRFPVHWQARKVVGADAERFRLARAMVEKADEPTVLDQTLRALRLLLLHGKSSGADVAQSLAMHRRTLNRRLKAAGVTFQQVLDHVRFAVAKELLQESDIALREIAIALGYANGVSLIPAFRRWTGTTPGAWREAARKATREGS